MGHSDKPLFVVGGILAALALIVGYNSLVLKHGHHGDQPKDGQALIEKETDAGATKTAAGGDGAAPAATADIATLVAAGNVDKGKKLFRRCASCHSYKKGDPPALGPNLYGVVGRALGADAAFSGYSAAIKEKGGNWTVESLSEFIKKPKDYIPGTKMIFAGINSDTKRADLIAYIKTLAD